MSGFLSFVGLAVMVVAVLRLFGRARWAHIASRRLAWLVLAAGFGIGMAGGALASSNASNASAPARSPSPALSSPVAATPSPALSSPAAATPSAAPSHSAAATSPATPAPAPTTSEPKPTPSPSGTLRWHANIALPDSKLTPGGIFPGVTAAQVCVSGWAEAHRNVPDEARHQVFAEYGLSYGVHASYEVDHLIPLELGGSNAIRNLWPEPEGGSQPGYPSKDRLENRLHQLVCGGSITLAAAQHAIAANWWAAYTTYLAAPAPSPPARPAPVTSPASTPGSSSGGGGLPVVHPGAFCSDAGARGVTTRGTPMTCKTTASDSRLRWRSAT
jgi:hypothetical protein